MNSKQDLEAFLRELKMIFRFGGKQKTELIKNIEKLTFWAGDNEKLHFAKQELLSQINNLDISISGKGFFVINRQFLAGVSLKKTVDHFQLYNNDTIYDATISRYAFLAIISSFLSFTNRWPPLVVRTSSFSFSSIYLESKVLTMCGKAGESRVLLMSLE